MASAWKILNADIIACARCPRLRAHCAQIAEVKRAAYRDWDYWGKPVPNMGSHTARLLILGLAPGAHGANRTGRMFTGDKSGDFLFRAMHEAGFATQAASTHRGDGLELVDCAITATAHCAPPDNKPTPGEIAACEPFLHRTIDAMPQLKGFLLLGRIAFDAALKLYRARRWLPAGRKPTFGHGAFYEFPGSPFLMCSFHPSQQNTFTGRLTHEMLRDVFKTARGLIDR